MPRLLLRGPAPIGIGLELLGGMAFVLLATASLGYATFLAVARWPVTGMLLGSVALVAWSVCLGAIAKLIVRAARER